MAPEYVADTNDVIIFTHDNTLRTLSWEFVPLSQVPKKDSQVNAISHEDIIQEGLEIRSSVECGCIEIIVHSVERSRYAVKVFSLTGQMVLSDQLINNERKSLMIGNRGVYFVQVINNRRIITKKVLVD